MKSQIAPSITCEEPIAGIVQFLKYCPNSIGLYARRYPQARINVYRRTHIHTNPHGGH